MVKAGLVNDTDTRSLCELLDGIYLAAVRSSPSFYVDDPVPIIYGVRNHKDAFRYWLKVVAAGSEQQRVSLTDFRPVGSLQHNLSGGDWPSEMPTDVRGGNPAA